jgi:hypothetical protein
MCGNTKLSAVLWRVNHCRPVRRCRSKQATYLPLPSTCGQLPYTIVVSVTLIDAQFPCCRIFVRSQPKHTRDVASKRLGQTHFSSVGRWSQQFMGKSCALLYRS